MQDRTFTALVRNDGDWWIGWIQEIPGINSQERSREELMKSLASALKEGLELNREEALSQANGPYEEEAITLPF